MIERIDNIIKVPTLGPKDFPFLMSHIHHTIEKAGYENLTLDFSHCSYVDAGSMLAVCAQAIDRRTIDNYFRLEVPENDQLNRLFMNANWAHFIDPRRYDPAKKTSQTQTPATQYTKSSEQNSLVNRICNQMLGLIPDMNRADLQAFEWTINEITDNVLVHSHSQSGGLVQLSFFPKNKTVKYMVADAGMGIPHSMRSGRDYSNVSDFDALHKVIEEGVTRDKAVGQGNGLYGSYQISRHCQGMFEIRSGHAHLQLSKKNGLHVKVEKIPYTGTLIVGEVDFSMPKLLEEALKFGGKKHVLSYDHIDHKYENDNNSEIRFILKNEAESLGSRTAGTPVRNKLKNLFAMSNSKSILIDFEGIHLMSSSFADEVFGKLFKEIGPMAFMQRIQLHRAPQTCKDLIDKAITQRMGQ